MSIPPFGKFSSPSDRRRNPPRVGKGYEIAPNEFAAIDPQEIKGAEIETSDTIAYFTTSFGKLPESLLDPNKHLPDLIKVLPFVRPPLDMV